MKNRERFLGVLGGKPVDRMPAVHFGYWRELLLEWADQGHISKSLAKAANDGNRADRTLDRILGWDFCYAARSGTANGLLPAFRRENLGAHGDGVLHRNDLGVVELSHPGTNGIPAEVDYLLKDRKSYEQHYKHRFAYHKIRNAGDRMAYLRTRLTNYYPRGINGGSVIGTIRSMCTLVGLSYLMYDDFPLVQEMVDDYANMQYRCLKTHLEKGGKYDFIHLWEDMCFNNGPLISPDMFDELCKKHYKRIANLAKEHGIPYISLDCDGDITRLLPMWEEAGINTMFPIEYGTWELDMKKIREVSPTLFGVGGMNKNVLAQNHDAVDQEIARLKPLVKLGGYLPCPDHRIPQGAKFELVQYYTAQIKKILD